MQSYKSCFASQLVIYKHEAVKFERSFTKQVRLLLFSYCSTCLKWAAEGSTWWFETWFAREATQKSECIPSRLNSLEKWFIPHLENSWGFTNVKKLKTLMLITMTLQTSHQWQDPNISAQNIIVRNLPSRGKCIVQGFGSFVITSVISLKISLKSHSPTSRNASLVASKAIGQWKGKGN